MSYFKFLYISSATITGLLLAGCSSTPPSSSAAGELDLASVHAGEKALIVMNNSGQGCEQSLYTFNNTATNEDVIMRVVQPGRRRNSVLTRGNAATLPLDPGTYQIVSGSCINNGFHPIRFGNMHRWFEPFEVAGGEVRYLGNLNITATNGEGRQGLANAAIGRLFNLGFENNKANQYVVHRIISLPRGAKAGFEAKYPTLAETFQIKPIETRISAKDFRKVVNDAYAPDETGKEPLKSDANKIVIAYLESFD